MDSGGMEFGDADGAKRILREIAEGTELGRSIGNGAAAIGRKRGHHRVPVVRGQALPAWDPRPLKATGITYCTSAMGADHTAGLIVEPGQPQEEMAAASQRAQIVNAVVDSSGFCSFMMINLDEVRGFYGAYFGEDLTRERIADMGWQILCDEWEFNRRADSGSSDDAMPDCMKRDPIGPAKWVWDVPNEVVAQAFERFENTDELFELRS
jgi:aldehyde:ferredoxin oxidoreductase